MGTNLALRAPPSAFGQFSWNFGTDVLQKMLMCKTLISSVAKKCVAMVIVHIMDGYKALLHEGGIHHLKWVCIPVRVSVQFSLFQQDCFNYNQTCKNKYCMNKENIQTLHHTDMRRAKKCFWKCSVLTVLCLLILLRTTKNFEHRLSLQWFYIAFLLNHFDDSKFMWYT